MKRKDLKVGAELYCQEQYHWNRGHTFQHAKVVIIAVEPHRRTRDGKAFEPGKPFGSADDVLVDFYRFNADTGFNPVRRTLVRAVELRGPYAETLAGVEKAEQAMRDAAYARAGRQGAVKTQVTAIMDRARRNGWSSVTDDTNWSVEHVENARVSMSLADFERMLNKIDSLESEIHEEADLRLLDIESE